MAEHHAPNPMHELQDHWGSWTIFERFLDGKYIPLPPPVTIGGYTFQITKFMLLELVAAGIILAIYIPLAKRIKGGGLPTGWWWNLFEGLFVFIRDQIARPNLDDPHAGHEHEGHGHGEHDHGPPAEAHEADKYVPFLATMFLFILLCNLLGLVPFLGSPTASIWVTAGLALCSLVMMHGAAIAKVGVVRYLVSLWPRIDVPYVGWFFSLFIFLIELAGSFIKSGVLAVRLFANMFAGHMSLAMILLFIWVAGSIDPHNIALWSGVSLVTVFGMVALSLLELFVALLQAYIFTFLTALFMGMSLHPEH